MNVKQRTFVDGTWSTDTVDRDANLVLAFGSGAALRDVGVYTTLRRAHPGARVVLVSSAGEIAGDQVLEGAVVANAISFENTQVRAAQTRVADAGQSRTAGRGLASDLNAPDLAHVLLFSDGLHVNAGELVRGLQDDLPSGVGVTGGLAGDGADFSRTLVGLDSAPGERTVVAIGLYGSRIAVGWGSVGGWDPFGPERTVTKSRDNVLYELDGQPALALYRRYLGDQADGLPSSGLLFPLLITAGENSASLVRTILGIDDAEGSLTFAGDIPEGSRARLMKANFDRLIDGAGSAAEHSSGALSRSAEFALLISCVGRRLVLQQRVEEEVESVRDILGAGTVLGGFYSYGEISPLVGTTRCELHNQTMTITTLAET